MPPMNGEYYPQESGEIDRIIRGEPPRRILIKRALDMLAEGWLITEIAAEMSIEPDSLYQILSRHKRGKKK